MRNYLHFKKPLSYFPLSVTTVTDFEIGIQHILVEKLELIMSCELTSKKKVEKLVLEYIQELVDVDVSQNTEFFGTLRWTPKLVRTLSRPLKDRVRDKGCSTKWSPSQIQGAARISDISNIIWNIVKGD